MVSTFADIDKAGEALIALRRNNPEMTAAILLGIEPNSNEARLTQIRRMLDSATQGTTIASTEAAMAFKARNPEIRLEPLGELPDAAGAIGVYAIAM